jgi:hypothetical protein
MSFFSAPLLAVDYQEFCEIQDGKAYGYVAVTSYDSLTISGYVTFHIYDEDGDLIDEENEYEYEYIYHDTEVVSEIDVDNDASWCSFDVSDAIEDPNPTPDPGPVDFSTRCLIEDGQAKGYVTVHSYDSLTISGNVMFRIYDEDGDLIDEEEEYEYEYIYHDTELVSETNVDDEARWCSFDISQAIDL